jgi:asparagine synthase (glutamine-hydrolysing)
MQPLTNPEYPHWHVLCNGEIYNYKQLAFDHNIDITKLRSDVEILLYLNPKKITEWASKISGDFSAIFYNDKTGEFVLIRDQIGVRPLYVAYDSNNEIFASASIQDPLLELQGTVRVKQFPPGHLYLSSTGRTVRYSNLFSTPTSSQSPSPCITNEITAMNGVSTILLESVRKRLLHSHVPVAVLCSGGIDSSIILVLSAYIWQFEMNRPLSELQVFTMEYNGGDHVQSTDTFYAKLLTKSLGVKHTVISFSESDIKENIDEIIQILETDDYRTVRASIPQYMLSKWIHENTHYKVILSGEGADELFAGYNYFYLAKTAEDTEAETERLVQNLHRFDVLRADRVISANNLEIRVPFLDKDFVQFVFSISGNLRNTQNEKELLRNSFAQCVHLINTGIFRRGKEKFSDGCGLSYIPALMRYTASKYVDVNDIKKYGSVHLLQEFEGQYIREKFREIFAGDAFEKLESNYQVRELPVWADTNQNQAKQSEKTGVEFDIIDASISSPTITLEELEYDWQEYQENKRNKEKNIIFANTIVEGHNNIAEIHDQQSVDNIIKQRETDDTINIPPPQYLPYVRCKNFILCDGGVEERARRGEKQLINLSVGSALHAVSKQLRDQQLQLSKSEGTLLSDLQS